MHAIDQARIIDSTITSSFRFPMLNKSIFPLLVTVCLTLSACGQKGPLYISQDEDTQAAQTAPTQPSEAETQNKKEKPAE